MGHQTVKKFLFVLLSLSCFFTPSYSAMSKEMVENSKKILRNMCINRTKTSNALLAQLKSGEFPEDRKLQCYISCCLQFMKIMNKEKITYDVALKQINSQLPADMRPPMLESLEACKNVEGKDGCELGYNYALCAYKNNGSKNLVVPT